MSGEATPLEARLADLQKAVEVGFAVVKGEMAVFSERDRASAESARNQTTAMETLTARVNTLDTKVARAVGVAIGVSSMLSVAEGFVLWALTRH